MAPGEVTGCKSAYGFGPATDNSASLVCSFVQGPAANDNALEATYSAFGKGTHSTQIFIFVRTYIIHN